MLSLAATLHLKKSWAFVGVALLQHDRLLVDTFGTAAPGPCSGCRCWTQTTRSYRAAIHTINERFRLLLRSASVTSIARACEASRRPLSRAAIARA